MRTLLAGLALACTAAVPRIEVEVAPQRAVAHEEVRLRVRVTHTLGAQPVWEPPPFEGFWSERLATTGGPLEHDSAGRPFRRTTFRRSLFATQPGRLEIPSSLIRYRSETEEERVVEVPGAAVQIDPLPSSGRPPDAAPLVGAFAISVELDSSEVQVGRALGATVQYHGTANLWDAPAPDLRSLGTDVEVFPEEPVLYTGESGDHLTVRRSFRFDLVPRGTGGRALGPFELPYYDPSRGAWLRARAEPAPFEVVSHRPAETPPWQPRPERGARGRLPSPLWSLPVVAIATATWLWLSRWRREGWLRFAGPPAPSPGAAFERACAAIGTPELPARLADTVRARIHARHRFDPRPLTTEELATRLDDPVAIELLRDLDRTRFSTGAASPEALVARVRQYLET